MEWITYLSLTLIGLTLGSFSGATVWRLRARQLVADKAAGEKVDASELKRLRPLRETNVRHDRSRCLSCQHTLAWYDLLPLVSWISTRGRCRYCRMRIGYFEPLIELGTAAFFLISFVFWPFELTGALAIAQFVIWLVAGVGLITLLAYDAKWFLLPDVVMLPVIGLGVVSLGLRAVGDTGVIVDAGLAIVILSGIYYALYLYSKGQWIGFGDIKLGIALALLLADWQLALLTLFLANFIGTLIVLPLMVRGRLKRTTRVPFGPLLIIGFFMSGLFGSAIVDAYMNILL